MPPQSQGECPQRLPPQGERGHVQPPTKAHCASCPRRVACFRSEVSRRREAALRPDTWRTPTRKRSQRGARKAGGPTADGPVANAHKETFAADARCSWARRCAGTATRKRWLSVTHATRIGGHRCCGGGAVARQEPHNSTEESKERKPAALNGGHSCCGGGAAAWQGPQSNTVVSKVRMRPMVKHGRGRRIDQRKGLS